MWRWFLDCSAWAPQGFLSWSSLALWWRQEQISGCLWALGVLEFLHICKEEAHWWAWVSPLCLQVATWAGLSWRAGAALRLSLPCSGFLPLLCSQKEGGGVGNTLSLCSAFGWLSGTVGAGSHARENTNSELQVEYLKRVSKSVGRARKLTYLCGQSPLLQSCFF